MNKEMLTKRENFTLQRVLYVQKAAGIVYGFLTKGFGTLDSVVSIAKSFHPELTRDEVRNFWHFRSVNKELVEKMEAVLKNLKK